MKFEVDHKLLAKALDRASSIVVRRDTLPILSMAKLRLEGRQLEIHVTDMDLHYQETIEVSGKEDGSIAIGAERLRKIAKFLPDTAHLTFSHLDTKSAVVNLACGQIKYALPFLNSDDFPNLKPQDYQCEFTLPCRDLIRMFDKTGFAASTEETRYYLNGVFLERSAPDIGADQIVCVATNGHILSKFTLPTPAGADKLPKIIIPSKTVSAVQSIFGSNSENITISANDNSVMFRADNRLLVSRLIDAEYPDYNRVIPHPRGKVIEFNCDQLARSVDRVAMALGPAQVVVKFTASTGDLILSTDQSVDGYAEDVLLAGNFEHIACGFNFKYLKSILSHVDTEKCGIDFGNGSEPVMLNAVGQASQLFVVMPMRVKG